MTRSRQCWAIIPARGGSRGIPGKNLTALGGIPLVARTIRAARAAPSVERVFVSTDDAQIAHVAAEWGAEVVERPKELGRDETTSEAVLLHALDLLEAGGAELPKVTAFLQCTSPFTAPQDIEACFDALTSEKAQSVLTVAPFHGFLWAARNGEAIGVNHDKAVRQRRQDREPEYLETGAVYLFDTVGFRRARHRFFGRTAFAVTPNERTLEIDTPTDIELAALRLAALPGLGQSPLPDMVGALVMDFDGVLTDNRVSVAQDGAEAVVCSRADGMGLEALRKASIPLLILSKERNPVVGARAGKLCVAVRQGIEDKRTALLAWLREQSVEARTAIYVGNDVNDLDCMAAVGCAAAPSDAHPQVLRAAHVILQAPGGQGAIRELAEMILGPELRRRPGSGD